MGAGVGCGQAHTPQNRIMETQSPTDDLTSGPSLFQMKTTPEMKFWP